MDKSIVSPFFIYMLQVVNNVVIAACVCSVLLGIGSVISKIGATVNLIEYGKDNDDYKKCQNVFKKLFMPFLICVFLAVFVPDKTTLLQMYIADKITFERVEETVKVGKNLKKEIKNDIIEILQAIDKEDSTN